MDIIFIEKLTVMAVIGVYDWEQQRLQKLVLDLKLGWEKNHVAACSDNVMDCLNYTDVIATVLNMVNQKHFILLERVAEEVADLLIKQFKLPWISVKVSKPGAIPQAENVGVIIERTPVITQND